VQISWLTADLTTAVSQPLTNTAIWLRLVRSSDSIDALASTDGVNWVSQMKWPVAEWDAHQSIGLVSTSGDLQQINLARFTPVTVNGRPLWTSIADQTWIGGRQLSLTNLVHDPDLPEQNLNITLVGAPANASYDPITGILRWRPAVQSTPQDVLFQWIATDNGTPSLTSTQMFRITVKCPARPDIISTILSNGSWNVTVSGDQGPDYTWLTSTNLVDWTALWTTNPPAMPLQFTEQPDTNKPAIFYRLKLGP
jgi:hypothetical protein